MYDLPTNFAIPGSVYVTVNIHHQPQYNVYVTMICKANNMRYVKPTPINLLMYNLNIIQYSYTCPLDMVFNTKY